MKSYVFIESRDPFESRDTAFLIDTAAALKRRGSDVAVFLVQNGVLAARRRAQAPHLDELSGAGVTLLADEFSLAERGIGGGELRPGVRAAGIGELVEMLLREGAKAVWH